MTTEGQPRGWDQEGKLDRTQANNMNLSQVADGYKRRAEETFETTSAPAIRNEVKKYVNAADLDGPEQLEALQKLAKSLEAYKSVMADISSDPSERAAFALALIRREKALQ